MSRRGVAVVFGVYGVVVAAAAADVPGQPRSSCVVTETIGCFADSEASRVLPTAAGPVGCSSTSGGNTHQSCAATCIRAGFGGAADVFGVEFGCQCWCGHRLVNTTQARPAAECSAMRCPGNATEPCGGPDRYVPPLSLWHPATTSRAPSMV